MTGDDGERLRTLRHDLASPLSALLAETQLLLMRDESFDPDTMQALRDIESLARRMSSILREF